ncbi:hypothetical protein Anapl_06328 [Anas platyrhynchos]|uniref:Uncharacterized protein n=1 Tax=Anas platyrhynchos TaxID=8839 RepID=R0LH89_ANAPL|nr:hypothetical protein Anapl_06328 [Anas platyrhynchos]
MAWGEAQQCGREHAVHTAWIRGSEDECAAAGWCGQAAGRQGPHKAIPLPPRVPTVTSAVTKRVRALVLCCWGEIVFQLTLEVLQCAGHCTLQKFSFGIRRSCASDNHKKSSLIGWFQGLSTSRGSLWAVSLRSFPGNTSSVLKVSGWETSLEGVRVTASLVQHPGDGGGSVAVCHPSAAFWGWLQTLPAVVQGLQLLLALLLASPKIGSALPACAQHPGVQLGPAGTKCCCYTKQPGLLLQAPATRWAELQSLLLLWLWPSRVRVPFHFARGSPKLPEAPQAEPPAAQPLTGGCLGWDRFFSLVLVTRRTCLQFSPGFLKSHPNPNPGCVTDELFCQQQRFTIQGNGNITTDRSRNEQSFYVIACKNIL